MLKNLTKIFIAVSLSLMAAVSCEQAPEAPYVENGQFIVNGQPSYFVGTNLWYAGRLAGTEEGRQRLITELDQLKEMGVTNLRILAVEGESICNLEWVLSQLERRGMYAVLFLNNAWEWSYGYRNYLEAAGYGAQPHPKTDSYPAYMNAMAQYYVSDGAIELYHKHIRNIVSRLKSSDAIFSWQICNEPRPFCNDSTLNAAYVDFIYHSATVIKSIDHRHMVSIGNEGVNGCEMSKDICEQINNCDKVDYITVHIWPYNWGWVAEGDIAGGVQAAKDSTDAYIGWHVALGEKLGKPVVIEEFGYPRDGFQFAKGTPTTGRDSYYTHVFSKVLMSKANGGVLAGCNFWGWGGLAEQNPESIWWSEGDDFCGDPEQEQQGLNSVYASDSTTVEMIDVTNKLIINNII